MFICVYMYTYIVYKHVHICIYFPLKYAYLVKLFLEKYINGTDGTWI